MSSIAMQPASQRTSLPPPEPEPASTPGAAAVTGPATTSPRAMDPATAGDGSILSAVASLVGPSELHRIASESEDSGGKPPARTANLPTGIGTADDFKRGNK